MKVKEKSKKKKNWLKTQHSKSKGHGIWSHHFWQIDGETIEAVRLLFSWAPVSLQMLSAVMKLKDACSLEDKLWQISQHIKKQRDHFANQDQYNQSYGFSSSHVWM